jgi:hypothetical protein
VRKLLEIPRSARKSSKKSNLPSRPKKLPAPSRAFEACRAAQIKSNRLLARERGSLTFDPVSHHDISAMEAAALARAGRRILTRGGGGGGGILGHHPHLGPAQHTHHEMDFEEDAKNIYSNLDSLLGGSSMPHRVPANRIARAATILPSQIGSSRIRRGSTNLKHLATIARQTRPMARIGGVALPPRITGKDTSTQIAQSMARKRIKRGHNRIHLRSQSMGSVPFSQSFAAVASSTASATTTGMMASLFSKPAIAPYRAVVFTDDGEASGAAKGGGVVIAPPAMAGVQVIGGNKRRTSLVGGKRIERYNTAPARAFADYLNPFDDFLSHGSASGGSASGTDSSKGESFPVAAAGAGRA